jgi:hypothetical protein
VPDLGRVRELAPEERGPALVVALARRAAEDEEVAEVPRAVARRLDQQVLAAVADPPAVAPENQVGLEANRVEKHKREMLVRGQ